jgi:hypothetical protein
LINQPLPFTLRIPLSWRLPIKVKDFILRSYIFMGIAMAIQTESHAKGLGMLHHIHFIHFTVATHTGNTPVDVDRVVEINVIGRFMNLNPRKGFVFLETLSNWGEPGIIRQNLSVALHTSLSRRNVGKPTLVYVIVAISTINAHLARMNLMREGNRLDRLVPHPSIFRGKIISYTCYNTGTSYQSAHQKDQR